MWIYYTIGAIVCFTVLNLLQRVLAVDSKNPRAMSVVFNSFAACFAFVLFFLTQSYKDFKLPTENAAWVIVICATILYALFERGRFYVAKFLDASVFATVLNVGLIIVFIGSIIFLKESLTTAKIIGSGIILVALFLVSYKKNSSKTSTKGLFIGILISIIIGVAWIFDKKGTTYFNASTYNIFVWTIPVIFIYLPYIKITDLKHEFRRGSWKLVVLAFLNVMGYFFQLKALSFADGSVVFTLVSTSTIFTVLLGIFILKEKDNRWEKILAAILAVIGIYLLI